MIRIRGCLCALAISMSIAVFENTCVKASNQKSQSEFVSREQVKSLTDEYFEFRLRENPGYARAHGIDRYQDQVEEWNHEAFNRRINQTRVFLSRVEELMEGRFEDKDDYVSLKILQHTLRTFLDGSAYQRYTTSLNSDLSGIPKHLELYPITTLNKLENWYKLVIGYQSVFTDQIELLGEGIASRLTPAQLNVEEYIAKYKAGMGDTIDEFFAFKPWIDLDIINSNKTFYDEGQRECEALRAIMLDFLSKLENEYLPVSRNMSNIGVSSLPGGDDFYRATLKYYTSGDTTPENAHQLGLDEVERIQAEMKQIVKNQGFSGTVREYVETLYADPNEQFPTQDAVLQGYNDMLNLQVRPNMHKEFYPEPPIELGIRDDPYGSMGRYSSPKRNGTGWIKGLFLYDGRRPQDLLKITMLPILVHETLPGHHYQLAHVLLTSLPDFRKYTAYAHYDQGAFNFPYYGAYIEGWGLYSEYISGVMGIINTEKEKLGALSMESLRGARLVVDTGMHYYNWSYERAVEYLVNNTILSRHQCEGQITRYVRWPGQACSYKIGEIKIKALRQKAIKQLGSTFNPKDFHATILNLGSCPLEVMESEVTDWINSYPITASAAANKPGVIVAAIMLLIAFSFK